MKQFVQSFFYAIEGIAHALKTERNLKIFTAGYILSLGIGLMLNLEQSEWPFIVFAGGMFLAIELVNTALERLADAFHDHSVKQDDHYHDSIKATKDIAAGASLVCAVVWVSVLILVFVPHVLPYLR
jgi:diacylglycerol kinase